MLLSLLILAPLLILSLWLYFRRTPKTARRRALVAYDATVLLGAVVLSSRTALHLHRAMSAGPDRAWWPALAILASLGIAVVFLLVGGIVRNHLIFRARGVRSLTQDSP
jgi:NADH:ubiquinone oxidoreductase subunit 4 (subunit M)